MSQPARDDFAPYTHDPFGPSANPATYFPSQGSTRARNTAEDALDAGRVVGIVGGPGHGKTLLLRMLEERESARARVAYVPFPTLDMNEFFTLVLERLGETSESADPRDSFARLVANQAARGGVVLLIDDAHALPRETLKVLFEIFEHARGGLRLVLAAVDGDAAFRAFQAFGNFIDVANLDGTLSEYEVGQYIEMRLAYAVARPDLVAAFDDETVASLYRQSRGNPRGLNSAAQEVVRRAAPGDLPRLRELQRQPEPEEEGAEGTVSLASLAETVLGRAAAPEAPAGAPTTVSDRFAREAPTAPVATREARDGSRAPTPVPASPSTRQAPTPRRSAQDPTPAPGFESGASRSAFWSRSTALAVFKWMAFGGGVGVAVMWLAGGDAFPKRVEPREPRRITPASELNRRAMGLSSPEVEAPEVPDAQPTPSQTVRELLAPVPALAPAPAAEPPPLVEVPDPPVVTERAAPENAISVSINATPWATIEVDGRVVGETPLARVPLAPGPHDFRATMPDGSVREKTIEIDLQRRTVTFD